LSISSNGTITPKKPGYAKVKATLTYDNKNYTTSGWIYVAPKIFSENNAHKDYYVDIFGNSNKSEQIVYANPNVQYTIPVRYDESG